MWEIGAVLLQPSMIYRSIAFLEAHSPAQNQWTYLMVISRAQQWAVCGEHRCYLTQKCHYFQIKMRKALNMDLQTKELTKDLPISNSSIDKCNKSQTNSVRIFTRHFRTSKMASWTTMKIVRSIRPWTPNKIVADKSTQRHLTYTWWRTRGPQGRYSKTSMILWT